MIKKPTFQFFPANKFANVQYGESRGDGIHDLHRHFLRHFGKGHPHGGLSQIGKHISDLCARVSLTGNIDSLVSDGVCEQYTAPRTCHTCKHFSRVTQGSCSHCFVSFFKNSHLHGHGSCLTRNVHGLTASFFWLHTALHPCFVFGTGVSPTIRNMAFSLAVFPKRYSERAGALWETVYVKCLSRRTCACGVGRWFCVPWQADQNMNTFMRSKFESTVPPARGVAFFFELSDPRPRNNPFKS